MQAEERDKLRKQVVTLIRSLLISSKGGVNLDKINRKFILGQILAYYSVFNGFSSEIRVELEKNGSKTTSSAKHELFVLRSNFLPGLFYIARKNHYPQKVKEIA